MPRPNLPPSCAACGYDLTGVPITPAGIRCPECGDNRVRLLRWHEPNVRWSRAVLYLPVSLAIAVPGVLAGWVILLGTSGQPGWLVVGPIPYACLGVALALWRPSAQAGAAVLGLGTVLALVLGLLLAVFMRLPPGIAPLATVPLGVMYVSVPVPLGVLWAHAVIGDS